MGRVPFPVTRGLDPRVHRSSQKLFAKRMDCRGVSAFTRVFDALCPAMTHAEKPLAAVAQHEAGAAGAADAAAQRFRGVARLGAHAHLVERLRAAAAQERAQQARIAPREKFGVAPGEARGAW